MEATPQQAAEGLAIVRVLAAVLDQLVYTNTIARTDPGQITKFHAMKAPGIAIQQYLERIHKYASCSNECFILALIYIDRLIQRQDMLLTELNVHRVVVTAVLLAAKFFDDAYYNNAYYAKVGGVLVSELNGLEVDFLFRINFSLHVKSEEFEKYRIELLSRSVVGPTMDTPTLDPLPPAPVIPAVFEAPIAVNETDNRFHFNAAASNVQITPSPPSTAAAAQMVEALVHAVHGSPDPFYAHTGFVFPSVHRANSMPPKSATSSPWQRRQPHSDPMHARCSRPMCAMPQFPAPDESFMILQQQQQQQQQQQPMYHPTGTMARLVHHHHREGNFHRPVPVVDTGSGYVVVSMSNMG